MRKYMNFNEESRLEVTQPEVVSFVMSKSEQLAGSISASVVVLLLVEGKSFSGWWFQPLFTPSTNLGMILLMEEILHQLIWNAVII